MVQKEERRKERPARETREKRTREVQQVQQKRGKRRSPKSIEEPEREAGEIHRKEYEKIHKNGASYMICSRVYAERKSR